LREANGSLVTFTLPGGGTNNSAGTYGASLNALGTIVGFSYDSNFFGTGLVRFGNGELASWDVPEAGNQGTIPFCINSWNVFTGTWYDANGTGHGFTALAIP
jgi:hypothetical protein